MTKPNRDRLFKAAAVHMRSRPREYRRSGMAREVLDFCLASAEIDKRKYGLIDLSPADIGQSLGLPPNRVDAVLRHEANKTGPDGKPSSLIARAPSRKSTDPIRYQINIPALDASQASHQQKQEKIEQAKAAYLEQVTKRQEALAKRQAKANVPGRVVRKHNLTIGISKPV
ncbi:MAG: hypothetical protein ACR2P3_01915 [Geminicoccaceae bacterium]